MNQFGNHLRIQIMGESHGDGVGITLDGVPAGMPIDEPRIQASLDRRRPGQSTLTTSRKEADQIQWLTGHYQGRTTGAPLHGFIQNGDTRSKDYEQLARKPRPGHADYSNHVASHGYHDIRGGGHNSGRLTASLVAAGEMMQSLLDAFDVRAGAYLAEVGDIDGTTAASAYEMDACFENQVYGLRNTDKMAARIEEARNNKDSVGGIIRFRIDGLPIGLGDPFFCSMESMAAHLLFSVPAVKGVDFGAGFDASKMTGSEHNDPFHVQNEKIVPKTNRAGGILGGRSTGTPVTGRVAFKPTSSIFQPQATVDLATNEETTLELKGRHDPCVAIRAVPVIRACMQILAAEWILGGIQTGHLEHPWK